MVVPKHAMVKLTALRIGVDDDTGLEWNADDLRKQLMLMHHECAEHAKAHPMMFAMQQQVWYLDLQNLHTRLTAQDLGFGIRTAEEVKCWVLLW